MNPGTQTNTCYPWCLVLGGFGYVGSAVTACSVASAYPDLIGPLPVFALEAALAPWWVAVGWRLGAFA